MIYNLVQLLRNQFTTLTIYVNGVVGHNPQSRCLVVNDTGGTEELWTLVGRYTAQVIARDVDAPTARKLAYDVFTFLTSRFGLIMPAITVDGVAYPQIQTAQVAAIQLPYLLGPDDDGRTEYSTNYQIIVKR